MEITLALGIVAFALVAIMGLFPVAMKNALESQNETRATFIAQSIFSDLESGPASTNTFLAAGTNWSSPGDRVIVNLKAANTFYVKYSDEGAPVGTYSNVSAFEAAGGDAAYGARVIITPDPVLANLSRAEVQVESPLSAASASRAKFNFVTLLPNNLVNTNQ
ncbi:MAG TPA: hypothetical protein VIS74_00115 [Chthoniobacterales bacterium]